MDHASPEPRFGLGMSQDHLIGQNVGLLGLRPESLFPIGGLAFFTRLNNPNGIPSYLSQSRFGSYRQLFWRVFRRVR